MVVREFFCADMAAAASATSLFQSALIPSSGSHFIFCCQFWNLLKLVSTPSTTPALFGGGLLGYVMYDVTHYYLHHAQPTSEVPRNLKLFEPASLVGTFPLMNLLVVFLQKYHLNHHFRIQNRGFGITSSFWDKVFGTLPQSKAAAKSI
ncbi:hypothetical protein C3L33_15658, partial [Rhododendron williamsianum]